MTLSKNHIDFHWFYLFFFCFVVHWFLLLYHYFCPFPGPQKDYCSMLSCSVMSDSLQPRGLQPTGLGSSVRGVFQARILEWIAISFTRGSSRSRDQTHVSCVSCTAGRFFIHWVIREAQQKLCQVTLKQKFDCIFSGIYTLRTYRIEKNKNLKPSTATPRGTAIV